MNFPLPEAELEKIRGQYDRGPYPRYPIDQSPKERYDDLYIHNLVTSYYLRYRQVIDPKGRVILDAGCGSGYKSLMLAEANPGAKIVGVDLSEESIKLARQRLEFHGFDNAEFYALSLYDIAQLGLEFDYINCDEVLYLLPDPVAGLNALKSVLKPQGLIRVNLHNAYQRESFYRGQAVFKMMGLVEQVPTEFEEEAVLETMRALNDDVLLKAQTWQRMNADSQTNVEVLSQMVNMNYLLLGDKGFTIPETFAMLEETHLEFISVVQWRHWDVLNLFKDTDNLPALLGMGLASASTEEKLHLFELLNPVHRLIDFWCGHPTEVGVSVDEWEDADWQTAIAHLHPQIRTDRMREELIRCIREGQAFDISRDVPLPSLAPVRLEPTVAACLLPLWESAQPIQAIAQRYRSIRAVDPVTLEPTTEVQAFAAVKDLLNRLDAFLYVLLEQPNEAIG
ncbi:MAG TPA: class I SAM-dependent methyltransferase [Coleofasciculaceae cyanobacterium]